MTGDPTRPGFSWAAERALLDGLPCGGLNIAHEAVDRHAAASADRTALRWIARDDAVCDITYGELAADTDRFASLLDELGVEPGETVFALLGRVPELHVAALGTLKRRAVFSPLYSAFGPEPVAERLLLGAGTVLVTTPRLYTRRVQPVRDRLTELRHVLLVGPDAAAAAAGIPGGRDLTAHLGAGPAQWTIPPTSEDDIALLHFTSGTTGRPKGALHAHEAVVAHHATGRLALDLQDGDVFWCTADPGWVTGISYGVITPLTHGVTCLVDEREFDAARWYRTLAEQRVTVWYTAPTAIRMLMRAGPELAREYDLSALRLIASVGEPLNAEAVRWGAEHLGLPIRDTWWQTETGGIMIGNLAGLEVRPGSMGRPLPGIEAGVARRGGDGELLLEGGAPVMAGADEGGELLLRAGWPSMFRGYLGDAERYARCFAAGWYRTGDLARRDADGWYWFLGRGDDVIKSAGHLIGPFEVERVLMEHPAVVEAGVIGVPDEMAGERIKAFVVPASGVDADTAAGLPRELLGFARTRLGAVVAPKEIEVCDALPHTRSGKVMRRLLRARELGLPEGDLSTLETDG